MGRQAAAIGERLLKQVADAMKMLVLELDRELRRVTPVDTGHARRNWVPSVGSQHTAEADDDAAHEQGIADVLAYTLDKGPMWVSNVAPYIQLLNYGHSKQRPAGFVEVSIDIAIQRTREKLAKKGSSVDLSAMQAEHRSQSGAQAAGNVASAYSPFGDDS